MTISGYVHVFVIRESETFNVDELVCITNIIRCMLNIA